ncbi:MAG: glycosyltransferase family A protein [Candidatus Magasanikbacteria bacterium]|jgi:glycosyltransferase involved in cell wall biosynthesis
MKNLVSIIIPVYNHAHTLEVCLKTISIQDKIFPLELIIVNDGSTDNFQASLEYILQKYPDIKALNPLVIDQINSGAPTARNRGFREAHGEYVIFVDADTVCYSGMIETMKKALDDNQQASYAYSQFRFGWKKMKSHIFDSALLKKLNYIDVTSLIRARDFVPFDESLKRFQDWDLWLTMLKQNKTGVFVPQVLYKKIVRGRKGISSWIPSWFYRLPWKIKKVEDYEKSKQIIFIKHGII